MQSKSAIRRSSRIARELPIVVRWQPAGRDIEDDPAKTVLLSKHGCSFTCSVPLKLGTQIHILDSARQKNAIARVLYRQRFGSESKIAVEFVDTDSFWDVEFSGQMEFASART